MPDEEEAEQITSEEDDPGLFFEVLREAANALDEASLPYLAAGSIALTAYGDPEPSTDGDLFIRRADADAALDSLARRGFSTEKTEPEWLYKAYKNEVLVDLIFVLGYTLELDDEMLRRARRHDVKGSVLSVLPPEDFAVSQALSNKEDAPQYWYNGIRALRAADIDWDYLLRRADLGPLRVLSLLVYARSEEIDVPSEPLEALWRRI